MVAEAGHEPNRAYFDQRGNIHLNGATLFDGSEVPISGPGTTFRMVQGQVLTRSAADTVETGLALLTAAFILEDADGGPPDPKEDEPEHAEGGRGHKGGRGHRAEHEKAEHEKAEHEKAEHEKDLPPPITASCSVANQAAAPGSIVINTWETAGDDPTPKAATKFGKPVHWIAIGT